MAIETSHYMNAINKLKQNNMNKTNLPTDGFCIKVDMNDPLFLKCKQLLEENYELSDKYKRNGCCKNYIGFEPYMEQIDSYSNIITYNVSNGPAKLFTPSEFLEIVGESGEDKEKSKISIQVVIDEGEKQINDWLGGSTEKEKEHYRVAFRRSYEFYIRASNQPKE